MLATAAGLEAIGPQGRRLPAPGTLLRRLVRGRLLEKGAAFRS